MNNILDFSQITSLLHTTPWHCWALAFAILASALFVAKSYFSGGIYKQTPIDLSAKYAVVTGGNSGIGAETVKYFASLGCSIIIGARDRKTGE